MNRLKLLSCSRWLLTVMLALTLMGVAKPGWCDVSDYLRLLRPRVLKQLDADMVRLMNELPNMDHQNEKTIGRLFAHGGLRIAKQGQDGVYRAEIGIPKGEFIWDGAIIVMPRGGVLELEFVNHNPYFPHAVMLPSNGNPVALAIAAARDGKPERGRARIRLDGPGMYSFADPVANHMGRGMMGMIVVGGEAPLHAKLDRPPQKRP